MNKIQANILILLALTWFFPNIGTAAELTFNQALNRLYTINETLQAARCEENQHEAEKAEARGLYFPKIDAGGSFTRIDNPIEIGVPGLGNLPIQEDNFWRLSIRMKWPVFTGGQIMAANRAADALLDESRQKKRFTESTLISELARRYYGLRLTQKVAAVRFEVLQGMNQHLNEAMKLEKQGIIANSEKLHAEVAHAEAEREYQKAVRDVAIIMTSLNDILSFDEDIAPVSPLFLLNGIEDLESFRAQARSENPSLKQLTAQREATHQFLKKEEASFSPIIYLFCVDEIYQRDLTALDPRWAAGIGVTYNLFEGFSGYQRIEAARSKEQRLKHLEQGGRLNILTLVEKRYQEVMKALEQYRANEKSLRSANEYLRVRTSAFKEGYATSIDVVDAQLSLSKVKTDRLTAVYEYDIALVELLEASGSIEQFTEYMNRSEVEVRL